MARDCANCFNCRVSPSTRMLTPNHRKYKWRQVPSVVPNGSLSRPERKALWERLNTAIVWDSEGRDNSVGCAKDHWMNKDGEVFTYISLLAFMRNGHDRTIKFAESCPDYEV